MKVISDSWSLIKKYANRHKKKKKKINTDGLITEMWKIAMPEKEQKNAKHGIKFCLLWLQNHLFSFNLYTVQ